MLLYLLPNALSPGSIVIIVIAALILFGGGKKISELTKTTVYCNKDNVVNKGYCATNNNCSKKTSTFYRNFNTPSYDIYMRSLITKRSCFNNS